MHDSIIPQLASVTLDDLIEMLQILMQRYWPDAEWATVVVKRPDVPNLVFAVKPASDPQPE